LISIYLYACIPGKRRGITGEVEATNVVHPGVLHEAPDFRLLQVVDVIVVGSSEVSAETPVVASNDNTTATSLDGLLDAVLDTQTSGLDGIVQNGRVLVVTGATNVHDAVGRQHVLGATRRVLGSSASDELGVVVVEEVFVERLVLLLG
jgi:hypothetical protein